MSGRRVFFYVQHLLGIGHLRRAATIARALRKEGLSVAFLSGGPPVAGLDLGGAELVQLPPALTADAAFSGLVDADGRPVDAAWRERRRAALLEAFDRIEPEVVLIELFPFGRRAFRFELLPLLEAAAKRRPRRPACVSSVRDILVAKNDPGRLAETVSVTRRYFDRVLVHGDPRLVRFDATFAAATDIADLLHYTGYVVDGERPTERPGERGKDGESEVLVSAGGGAVGEALLRTALAARPLTSLKAAPWRFVTGTNMPEAAAAALAAAAPAGVVVERFREDFPNLLRNCRLSISQGGYNTVLELLCAGARAVIVPFARGGETEQTLRAQLLAERGLCTVVDESGLTPEKLAAAIEAALAAGPARIGDIDVAGAAATARAVAALATAAADGTLPPLPRR